MPVGLPQLVEFSSVEAVIEPGIIYKDGLRKIGFIYVFVGDNIIFKGLNESDKGTYYYKPTTNQELNYLAKISNKNMDNFLSFYI
jgi:hypothetical protein